MVQDPLNLLSTKSVKISNPSDSSLTVELTQDRSLERDQKSWPSVVLSFVREKTEKEYSSDYGGTPEVGVLD